MSHPEMKTGTNFTCNNHNFDKQENKNYRENYDKIFRKTSKDKNKP